MKILFFIGLLISVSSTKGQQSSPLANNSAIIYAGNARFTILTPELIRMEWSGNKKFTDEASQVFINRKVAVPVFTQDIKNNELIITTAKLQLRYKISADSFSIANPSIQSVNNDQPFVWKPGSSDSANLKGTMRTLDGKDGGDISILENGILSKDGWVLINDSKTYLFDENKWIKNRSDSSCQDWYFFGYGHNYKKALYDFSAVAGKIPIPPRFAFGYWWSRYWIYGEKEMKDLVTTFKKLDIPIDVMIIDMDWHETYGFRGNATVSDGQGSIVGWTGYTWNKNIFPQPKKFLKWMEDRHIKNALNLHPAAGIPPMEEKYPAFAKAYNFDTTGSPYIPYYGSDRKWASIYFDSILHPMEKAGVDFWWLDWQQYPYDRLLKSLSNTWWLNHLFFTDMQKRGKRPLLFHRWGGLGNHRYQVGFSGDTYTTWRALSFQPVFTSTASNVGYGYWSHDIGGHQISAEHPLDIKDGELFLRWMQFGIFSPVLRTHSTKRAEIDRRFWNFKNEYLDIIELIKLRYQLNPYIYTAARNAYDSGLSLCRPLYYHHPEKKEAYNFPNEYYFGDKMIVSPVVKKTDSTTLLSIENIWLPEGEWMEWFTGKKFLGNTTHRAGYAKTEIPVFVKAGSVIPMYSRDIKNLQQLSDTVILNVFRGNGTGKLYEDDGTTDQYKAGTFASTDFSQKIHPDNSTQIIISPVTGSYPEMKNTRTWIVKLNNTFPPLSVKVNGMDYNYSEKQTAGSWAYSGENLETIIYLPVTSLKKQLSITVIPQGRKEDEILLEGQRGFIHRLKYAMEMIKFEISAVDWGAAIPDPVLKVESLPARLEYEPQRAMELIIENNKNKDELRNVIMGIKDVKKENLKRICDFLELK
ncbi:MAG: TIM-barrel domain-containing protein [Ferruginibacter sp.]